MQKGDIVKGYTVIGIQENVGTYQDKTKHLIHMVDTTGVPFKAEELTEGKTRFVINKKMDFVVISPGQGAKVAWIKVDEDFLNSEAYKAAGLPEKELIYIAKEGMNLAFQRGIAVGETGMDDLVAKGFNIAKAIIDNANKLRG